MMVKAKHHESFADSVALELRRRLHVWELKRRLYDETICVFGEYPWPDDVMLRYLEKLFDIYLTTFLDIKEMEKVGKINNGGLGNEI